MNETHSDALFISPEEGVHDGCYLFVKRRCPVELAAYRERIESLPEPSEQFNAMTTKMALLRPTETGEEWQRMRDKIMEWDRIVVAESTKGGETCKTTKSTNCSDQQSSTSSQPEAMTTKT